MHKCCTVVQKHHMAELCLVIKHCLFQKQIKKKKLSDIEYFVLPYSIDIISTLSF